MVHNWQQGESNGGRKTIQGLGQCLSIRHQECRYPVSYTHLDVYKRQALLDLNVGAKYYLTEKVGFFIRGINLLDNKFERWYGYPAVGINGMAGLKVVF